MLGGVPGGAYASVAPLPRYRPGVPGCAQMILFLISLCLARIRLQKLVNEYEDTLQYFKP